MKRQWISTTIKWGRNVGKDFPRTGTWLDLTNAVFQTCILNGACISVCPDPSKPKCKNEKKQ
jgi:hypothetical protein